MDPATIFKIITNSTWIVTQLMGGESVRFSKESYLVEVEEATQPGTLLVLQASTPDADSPLQYSLSPDSDGSLFRVDPHSGALRLLVPLDYEQQARHDVRVLASSTGGRVGSSEATVVVQVVDVNEHAPHFALTRHVTQITEEDDHKLPRPIYTVRAEDEDAGRWGVLRYTLAGDGTNPERTEAYNSTTNRSNTQHILGNTHNTIVSVANSEYKLVEPMSGVGNVVGSKQSLASPTDDDVDFHPARDPGTSSSGRLDRVAYASKAGGSPKRINLSKMNSKPPLLDPGGGVTANGPSLITDGRPSYTSYDPLREDKEAQEIQLQEQNERVPAFTVDPETGTIMVMKPLDRDPPWGRGTWRLLLTASDGELRDTTEVTVNLKDINDNSPVFPASRVEAAVSENAPNGTSVVTITAEDFDDKNEGSNALILYSLQKNAIDEPTGRAIFSVNSTTGSISTAMCCLDREHASHYSLTLVATDGGGLQGSCDVEVLVADENDVPPRWGRAEWSVEVDEEQPVNHVLAALTVKDPDTHNSLAYRVVPQSGRGWELVQVDGGRQEEGVAELRALQHLDHENPHHAPGLRFEVQVTDQGSAGWANKYRVGVATVTVRVKDINDNPPVFEAAHQRVRVGEDSPLGTVVARVPATDIDANRNSLVSYNIERSSDHSQHFGVDPSGTVRLIRKLDRETTEKHKIIVVARDHGVPQREASATVEVLVRDVNDNAPSFTTPTYLKVHQKNLTSFVSHFTLTDADEWELGHGPPFSAYLDPRTSESVANAVAVTYRPNTEGGLGTVRVVGTLVRDAPSSVVVPVVTIDSGNPAMTATVSLTIAVVSEDSPTSTRDISVFSLKTGTEGGPPVPLGGVADDTSSSVLEYSWSKPNEHFRLDQLSGQLYLVGKAPEGSYDLELALHRPPSADVQASVHVSVASLPRHAALAATPLDVAASPQHLIDTHQTGSSLVSALEKALSLLSTQARSGQPLNLSSLSTTDEMSVPSIPSAVRVVSLAEISEPVGGDIASRLWLVAKGKLPLELLFAYNKFEIENYLGVALLGSGTSMGGRGGCGRPCDCCCSPRVTHHGGYSVTHGPVSTLVGPALTLEPNCRCINSSTPIETSNHDHSDDNKGQSELVKTVQGDRRVDYLVAAEEPEKALPPFAHAMTNKRINGKLIECNDNTCLNGGRCLPSSPGYRCVCPDNTSGPRCKVMTRHFSENGVAYGEGSWAWLPPLNPCSKLELSVQVLTDSKNGTILSTLETRGDKRVGMTLTLTEGRPEFNFALKTGSVVVRVDAYVADLRWHRLDIFWHNKTVEIIVDNCVQLQEASPTSALQTNNTAPEAVDGESCRGVAHSSDFSGQLDTRGAPLQLGHRPGNDDLEEREEENWMSSSRSFTGCLKTLRINGELQDLGRNLLSRNSAPGCPLHDCRLLSCAQNAICGGSPQAERCQCQSSWTGPRCQQRTVPASFSANSFLQIALLFTPPASATSIQLRLRTRQSNSLIVALRSASGAEHLVLRLRSGRPCLALHRQHARRGHVCLNAAMHDGRWHRLLANRYGDLLELTMDDGDGELQIMSQERQLGWQVDRNDWPPESTTPGKGTRSLQERPVIHTNFKEGCLDDIRICGRPLPLPPTTNVTQGGVVEAALHLNAGCSAPSACDNTTCPPPFSCTDTWHQFKCDCGEGFRLDSDGSSCLDVDECQYQPCLNSGSCYNALPGFRCSCTGNFFGQHCEHRLGPYSSSDPTLPLIVAALVSASILIGLLFTLVTCVFMRRKKVSKTLSGSSKDDDRQKFYCSKTPNVSAEGPMTDAGYEQRSSNGGSSPSGGGTLASVVYTAGSGDGLHLMEVHYKERSSTHTSLAPSLYELQVLPKDDEMQLDKTNIAGLNVVSMLSPGAVGVSLGSGGGGQPIRAPRGYRDEEDSKSASNSATNSSEKGDDVEGASAETPWPLLSSCCGDASRDVGSGVAAYPGFAVGAVANITTGTMGSVAGGTTSSALEPKTTMDKRSHCKLHKSGDPITNLSSVDQESLPSTCTSSIFPLSCVNASQFPDATASVTNKAVLKPSNPITMNRDFLR